MNYPTMFPRSLNIHVPAKELIGCLNLRHTFHETDIRTQSQIDKYTAALYRARVKFNEMRRRKGAR